MGTKVGIRWQQLLQSNSQKHKLRFVSPAAKSKIVAKNEPLRCRGTQSCDVESFDSALNDVCSL